MPLQTGSSGEALRTETEKFLPRHRSERTEQKTRVYPYGAAFAHVVGYSNETAGKSGLESIENSELLTSNAFFAEKFLNEFKDEKIMAIPS